jgi:hypothetical protein
MSQHHKWENHGAYGMNLLRADGVGCTRASCTARKRLRKTEYPNHSAVREEYSTDNGATWGDLKNGFSGRVPECKGGAA